MDDKLKASLFMARKMAKRARDKQHSYELKRDGVAELDEAAEVQGDEDLGDLGLGDLSTDEPSDTRGQILEATGADGFEISDDRPTPTKGPAERLKFLRGYLTHRTLRGR